MRVVRAPWACALCALAGARACLCVCMRACVCVPKCACVRARVRVYMRACACVLVIACVCSVCTRVRVCVDRARTRGTLCPPGSCDAVRRWRLQCRTRPARPSRLGCAARRAARAPRCTRRPCAALAAEALILRLRRIALVPSVHGGVRLVPRGIPCRVGYRAAWDIPLFRVCCGSF